MISAKELEKFKQGTVVPIVKEISSDQSAIDFFAKLSHYGRKENSILLESADLVKQYGEKSIGSADPCLKVQGIGEKFEISALNQLGEEFIEFIGPSIDFVKDIELNKRSIKGSLKPVRATVSEGERLLQKTHADILRAIAFAFKPTSKPFTPYCGLFGAISYDFIDQFEQLPKNSKDQLHDPDYELLFLDNLFLMDHQAQKFSFVANALLMNNNHSLIHEQCLKKVEAFEKALAEPVTNPKRVSAPVNVSVDVSAKDYELIVEKMKQHIVAGDVFQIVPSRTFSCPIKAEPFDIYRELRALNPSPYMFYFKNQAGVLLGSSPETFLKVEGEKEKAVEIRPIAGTRKRGMVNGKLDNDLDSRLENELRMDEKELAEHTMLVDLARNDVAKVSVPGTRHVNKPHMVEKYSHVMHLVSNVSGTLKPDLDALHAYLASMNMGTLTGAPKIKAMELLRKYEKQKRGFYGGSVGYLTPSGDFDSCIVIRSMRIEKNKAHIRAGAGIVFDSVPESEAKETATKAEACLSAIRKAQGAKE
ncbi:MAG: anthranilate synthase component 1 [archaeon]|jgi:anthranilate synthase component 1|nr:anthranilate synthase component 1 [archaeon]